MTELDHSILKNSDPLFSLSRWGVPEIAVDGVCYFRVDGQLIEPGRVSSDPETVLVARSLLKPWQFLACDVEGVEDFWALGLSSHSGEDIHIQELHRLAEATEVGEDDLFCPRSYPLDYLAAARLKLDSSQPKRLHHPCSGKHLLMMASCRKHGDPLDSYWDPEHPMQKRVTGLVGRELGEKPIWLKDSCGLPTIAVSARGLMTMWEKLSLSQDEKALMMKRIWIEKPRLIGGKTRLDSDLTELGKGRIIAKEGADGLLLVQSLPQVGEPPASCLIKLNSGYNLSYLALALYSVLTRIGDLPSVFAEVLSYLQSRLENWIPADQKLHLPPYQ